MARIVKNAPKKVKLNVATYLILFAKIIEITLHTLPNVIIIVNTIEDFKFNKSPVVKKKIEAMMIPTIIPRIILTIYCTFFCKYFKKNAKATITVTIASENIGKLSLRRFLPSIVTELKILNG